MVDRHGQQNTQFVALLSLTVRFEANTSLSPVSTVSSCLQTEVTINLFLGLALYSVFACKDSMITLDQCTYAELQ